MFWPAAPRLLQDGRVSTADRDATASRSDSAKYRGTVITLVKVLQPCRACKCERNGGVCHMLLQAGVTLQGRHLSPALARAFYSPLAFGRRSSPPVPITDAAVGPGFMLSAVLADSLPVACHNIRMPDGPRDAAPRLLQKTCTKCAAASTVEAEGSRPLLQPGSLLLQLAGSCTDALSPAAGAAWWPAARMPLLGPGEWAAVETCARLLAASAPGHAAIGSATSCRVPSTTPATSPFSRSPVCSGSQTQCLRHVSCMDIAYRCQPSHCPSPRCSTRCYQHAA
jgi:hypothetical protein